MGMARVKMNKNSNLKKNQVIPGAITSIILTYSAPRQVQCPRSVHLISVQSRDIPGSRLECGERQSQANECNGSELLSWAPRRSKGREGRRWGKERGSYYLYRIDMSLSFDIILYTFIL